MPDGRHAFFAQTVDAVFRTRDFDGQDALSSFLDDPSVMVVRAVLTKEG